VLVVDDYEPFCQLVRSLLQTGAFDVVGSAADGLEAVRKAGELQPDLILLDIGLPKLRGLDAAKQIRNIAPHARIVFLTQEASSEMMLETLKLGAYGYVHKTRTQSDLLPALHAALAGRKFVSLPQGRRQPNGGGGRGAVRHHVQFYSEEAIYERIASSFVADALQKGDGVVVIATKPHQEKIIRALRAGGVDANAAMAEPSLVFVTVSEVLGTFMVGGSPDPIRFYEDFGNALGLVSKSPETGESRRVSVCGEGVGVLCEEGNVDAAIQLERLCNDIAKAYDVDVLCLYSSRLFETDEARAVFETICTEHAGVQYS
jgi:CheY-like chemotaxis protein